MHMCAYIYANVHIQMTILDAGKLKHAHRNTYVYLQKYECIYAGRTSGDKSSPGSLALQLYSLLRHCRILLRLRQRLRWMLEDRRVGIQKPSSTFQGSHVRRAPVFFAQDSSEKASGGDPQRISWMPAPGGSHSWPSSWNLI